MIGENRVNTEDADADANSNVDEIIENNIDLYLSYTE
eukprot:CAMPEP_0116986734 /NCGR_PEP_ID=MMETSP0467-20121206/63062_1 /TAXON_ID=283647 /ORGANISM="Mesodinium pulex, Strain SPMC105" /LENGTH=36 /DNA_ID= /DNA_START= /DNA_END= /DNA_ORIENTATION=